MTEMNSKTQELIKNYGEVYRIAKKNGLLDTYKDEYPDVFKLLKESGILN